MGIEFILNDKNRLAVFLDLAKTELSEEQLADRNRLTVEKVKDALYPMEQEGIVSFKGEVHYLTEKGKKLALEIKKTARLGVGPPKRIKERSAKGGKFPGHDYKRR